MFGKPGLGALEIELPSDVRTVSSLEQIGGQVGDWSFDQNTLRLNVNEWADEAVQIFKLGLSL